MMKHLFLFVIGLCALRVLCGDAPDLRDSQTKQTVVVVSHRGDWQVAPENSIAAFTAAIRAGAAILET